MYLYRFLFVYLSKKFKFYYGIFYGNKCWVTCVVLNENGLIFSNWATSDRDRYQNLVICPIAELNIPAEYVDKCHYGQENK